MTVKQAHSRLIMQLRWGTRMLRVIHGRDARATFRTTSVPIFRVPGPYAAFSSTQHPEHREACTGMAVRQ
jgi:hypothetical protein